MSDVEKISGERFLADLREGVEALSAYRQGADSVRVSRVEGAATTYTLLVQETPLGWVATVPDVPGCLATGTTRDLAEAAVVTLLNGYAERQTLPTPRSFARSVSISVQPRLR